MRAIIPIIVFAFMATTAFASAQERALPDPAITPGATNPDVTQANIHQTICVRGWTRTVRPPEDYTYHPRDRNQGRRPVETITLFVRQEG